MAEPTCDTCGEPCQGGVRLYIDGAGHKRVSCDDDHACAEAWGQLSPHDRTHLGHDCRAILRREAAEAAYGDVGHPEDPS
jgi:hypothetical protein